MDSNKLILPVGYVLVKDPGLGEYQTPPGHRVEVARKRGRPARRVGVRDQRDFMAKMRELTGFMDRADALGAGGYGAFVKWGKTGKSPKMLSDVIRSRRWWAFLVSASGYIRLNPERTPISKLWEWKPGDWDYDEVRSPIPGFASTDFEGSTIRVRLPVMAMNLRENWMPGESEAPKDKKREAIVAAIRELYAQLDPSQQPATLEDWLGTAPTAELAKWLRDNAPFGEAAAAPAKGATP